MNDANAGAISWGTFRTEDLIERFSLALHSRSPTHSLVGEYLDMDSGAVTMTELEELYFLEDLFNALDEIAPEGTYFGSHPGDGSLFGFWPIDEDYG